jgi:hypothetical protein
MQPQDVLDRFLCSIPPFRALPNNTHKDSAANTNTERVFFFCISSSVVALQRCQIFAKR